MVQSTLQSAEEAVPRSALSGAETHVTNARPGCVNSTIQSVSSMSVARSSACMFRYQSSWKGWISLNLSRRFLLETIFLSLNPWGKWIDEWELPKWEKSFLLKPFVLNTSRKVLGNCDKLKSTSKASINSNCLNLSDWTWINLPRLCQTSHDLTCFDLD